MKRGEKQVQSANDCQVDIASEIKPVYYVKKYQFVL